MRKYRLKQVTYWDGLALGAFLATELFLFIFWAIDLLPPKSDAWVGFIGNITVASFSLFAAFFALRGNRVQISQTNDIEDERRQNALIAARAILPAILSEMSAVARNNLQLRFRPGDGVIGDASPHATNFKRLPDAILPDLKQCIEFADKRSQERLANILRHFQVQQAKEMDAGIGVIYPHIGPATYAETQAISDAIGWAVIHGLVGEAFAFARGGPDPIPSALNPESVLSAFIIADLLVENYPSLERTLKVRISDNRLERNWLQAA